MTKFLIWCSAIYTFTLAGLWQLLLLVGIIMLMATNRVNEIDLTRWFFSEVGIATLAQIAYCMAIRKPAPVAVFAK
jgi:hypothetical protein